jgi:hypothetical protein
MGPDSPITYDPVLPVAFVAGEIIPTGKRPVSAADIMERLQTELDMEYTGKDERSIGLTKSQAILRALSDKAADGDLEAARMLLDRIMGKPVQQVQSLNLNTSLKEFLDELRAARSRGSAVNNPFV